VNKNRVPQRPLQRTPSSARTTSLRFLGIGGRESMRNVWDNRDAAKRFAIQDRRDRRLLFIPWVRPAWA
jgi:hypothetical protein